MVAAALLAVGTPTPAKAANFTWNQANNGNYSWIAPSSWTALAGFPDDLGDVANLNTNILGANTIALDTNVTLSTLNIGDAVGSDQFLIQGGVVANPSILPLAGQGTSVGVGSIVMDAPGSAGVAINKAGTGTTDEIAALIYFNDALTITAASGKLSLTGALRSGQSDIIFAGAGTTEIRTSSLVTGGNVVKNDAGTLQFTVANTYGGSTLINAGTLLAGAGNILPTRTPVVVASGATFDINGAGQAFGSLAGAGSVLNSSGSTSTATINIGRDDTSTVFTGTISAPTAGRIAVTKVGGGTFVLRPGVASNYSGATNVQGGVFEIDFASSGSLTSLIGASALTLASGDFTLRGRAGLAVAQTLGNVTVNQSGGRISVLAGDATLTRLALGTLSFGSGSNSGTLLVSAPANTQVTISATTGQANGIFGAGRAVFTDGTNYDWLTTASASTPFALSGLATYTALPAAGPGVATTNYSLSANQTQTAAATVGTLKISSSGTATSLGLATFDLTFGASGGGLLVTGSNAFTISGTTGGLKVGASGGDVIIHNYNTGGLTISAAIKDFSTSVATRLVTAGTGVTTLTGTTSYTGDTMIMGGVLSFSNAGATGTGTLGLGVNKPVYIGNGATLRYTGATATMAGGSATTANSHTFNLTGGMGTIHIPTSGTTLTLAGVISGAGGLTKTGAGELQLNATATFSGPLVIAAGRVISGNVGTDGNANRIADNTPVIIQSGAFWELTGNDSVGSLAGAGTLVVSGSSARNPGIGADNTNTTFSGLLAGTQGNSISKRGSGVWTVAMPTTSTWVGGNTYLDAGVIRVANGMGQQFNTTATLVINNAAQSAIFDLNGSSQRVGALNFYNTASNIFSQGLVLLGNGGTLTLGGNVTVNAHNNTGTQAAGIIGSAGATLSMGNAQRTITVHKSLNLAPGEAELVIDAVIDGGGVAGGWLKNGGGTLRIQGQSLLNGTVSTRFDSGLTILDYTTAASAAVSNRINPVGIIDLRGGSVSFLGNAGFDVSQSVAGLSLAATAVGNTGGYSSLDLYSAGGRNLVLNLGPISQRLGGTVRLTLPAGVQSSVNGITTTTGNDLFTGLVGTLGAAVTVTDASGATSFATRVGTNIVPVAMASRDTLAGVLNGENITDATGYAGSLLNVVSPISVRFNAAGSSLLTIPDGGILKVISGGILQTAASATSNLSLTSGATTVGSLSVSVASTSGLIPGMPVSGTGLPVGARVTQVIDATTFLIDRPAVASETGVAVTAGAVTVIQGGTLRSPTRELIISNDTLGWAPNVFNDQNSLYPTKRLLITSSIDGLQGITKTGNGVLALRAGALANDFSGLVQIQAGVIELGRTGRGSFAIGDSAPIVFSNQDSANLRMLADGVSLSGVGLDAAQGIAGATAIGSPYVKVDNTLGLGVGQLLSGNGINPGSTVVSLSYTANYVSFASVAITGAATTNASANVVLANTAGLVIGQPISGAGIPAGTYITAISENAGITLSAPATATAGSVALTAAPVTQVTTAGRHGVVNNENLAITEAGAGFNGVFKVIVDPVDPNRFVLTGTPDQTNATPQTLVIDAGKRFVMSNTAYATATGPTVVQAASTYGETVGAISGGTRTTNSNYAFIDLGLGTTLTINQTQDSTFAGEFMGLGTVRIIGNSTLNLSNAHRNHGSIIIDSGTLQVTSTNNGAGGRIYNQVVAGNFPTITVNRFGALYLLRSINQETNGVGDATDVLLNSAAGTRTNLVIGSNFADTLPLGFYVWNTSSDTARTENINNIYFDSGTSYLTMHLSGNVRQILGATGLIRRNLATGMVRGRSLGNVASGNVNSSNWFIRNTGAETDFINAMVGGAGADVALAAGATTLGSATVTVTSTAGLQPFMRVSGTGIPAGAYVVSVTNATTFELSAPASATTTAQSFSAVALNKSITPWLVSQSYGNINGPISETDMGNSLTTYVLGLGLRALSLTNDYATFANVLQPSENVREALTGDLSVGANASVNALVLHNNPVADASGAFAVTGAAGTSLTNGSGAFLFTLNSAAALGSDNTTTLAGFDGGVLLSGATNEYLFHVINPGSSAVSPRLTAVVSAPLASAGHLTKSGRGTLVLSGANTAGGGVRGLTPTTTYWGTTINEGVLQIADLDNIGGALGDLTLAGGTLRLAPGFTDDISQRNLTFLSAGGTLDVTTNDLVLANAIGGAAGVGIGGLTKTGAGSLTLAATSTFTGSTRVDNGRLILGGGANNRLPSAAELFIGSGSGTASGVLQLGNADGATHQTVSSLSGVTGVQVADFTILNAGQGFTSAPIISFNAIGGLMGAQAAQAVATVEEGVITGITLTDPGLYRPGFAPVVTVTALTNASAASTNSVTLNVASTGGVGVGSTIIGAGIAAGTTVVAVVSNTQLTLSQNASVANGADLYISGGVGGNSASIVVRSLGQVTSNAIVGGASAVSNLTVDQDITSFFNGAIGGAGLNQDNVGIIKSGVGTLTLSGERLSYVGQTTVLGGRLNLTGGRSAAPRTSSVKVNAGAILNFNNTVGQEIALGAGVLDLGAGSVGSASLGFDIGGLTAFDRITTSSAAVTAKRVIINLTGLTGLTAGSYDLLSAPAGGLSGATYALGDLRTFGGHTFGLTSTDTAVTLTTAALPTDLYWRVGADVSWSSLNYANYDTNFSTDAAGLVNAKGFPGVANKLIFSATPGAATSAYVTTLDGDFAVGSLRFTSTPTGITSVTIAQGGPDTTYALTVAPANAADGITIDDNAGAILISAPIVLGADQTWSIAGTGENGSTLAVAGAVSGLAGNDLLIAGLAGASLTFSGANTYAGTTSFPGMTLLAGVNNAFSLNSTHILSPQGEIPGVLRLNGFNNAIGGLQGVGFVENADPLTAVTLTVGRNNQSTVFSGEIRDGGLTALSLTKVGNGSLTLTGALSHSGDTRVNGGTLNLTGSYVGSVASSYLRFGSAPTQSIVNVTGDVDLFAMQGADTFGAVSIFNQSAGTVRLFTTGGNGNMRVARIGYGYFNLTGGLFQMSNNGAVSRFNLNENNANAVGVGYVGGTGVLNNANAGGDWFILAYQGIGQFTVGQGGFVNRQNSTGQIGIVLGGTGTHGTLNIAGGNFDFGGSQLRYGNGSITNSNAFFNVIGGVASIGNNASVAMGNGRGNLAYNNFAGGTLRANAAITQGILPSLLGNTGGAFLTADNRVRTAYGMWTNTLFGAVDNSAVAGAVSANGVLTIDTNGFAVALSGLTAATGAGLTQADLSVTGGSGYVGAPAVVFSTAGLMPGGTPASGYAVIANGQVTGIVITSPGTYQPGTVPTVTLTGGGGQGAVVTVGALTTANTAGRIVKSGLGTLSFSGVNTFTTTMSINNGAVAVAAGGALNSSTIDGHEAGRYLVVGQSGAIVANTADAIAKIDRFTNAGSTGVVAVTAATASADIDLRSTALSLTGMGLGAGMGDVTYAGVFTPGVAGAYRLGGGGGVLTYAADITGGYETRVDIIGTSVAFSGNNTFKGGLVLNTGGTLQVLPTSVSAGYGTGAGGLIALGGTLRWATGSTTDITSGPGAIPGGISLLGTVLVDTNGNNVELAGSIGNRAVTGGTREARSGGLTKIGNGVLALGGANTFTGDTTVIDGSILLKHTDALAYSLLSFTNVMNAASLGFDSSVASRTFTVGGLNAGSQQASAINIPLVDNLGNAITLRVGNGGQDSAFGGQATAVFSGAGGLTKIGSGTLNINGTAQTYTGATTIIAGAPGVTAGGPSKISTLALNFTHTFTASGATTTTARTVTSNLISASSVLIMGGVSAPQLGTQLNAAQLANLGNGSGRLRLVSAAAATTQTFASTTLGTGASDIVITSSGTHPALLTLGAITRGRGATLFVGNPANTLSATNGVQTTSGTASTLLTDANGTAYAVLATNSSTTVTDWAMKNAGNVWLTAATYTDAAAGATAPGAAANVNLTATNTTAWNTQTINSLRMNATTAANLVIGANQTLTIGTGGILFGSSAAAASLSTTAGQGTIVPGTGRELVIFANNTLLTINAVLGESAAGATDVTFRGLVSVGLGKNDLLLKANNTYSGDTYISGVRVRTDLGSVTAPFGTGVNGNVYIYGNNGGQFMTADNVTLAARNWYIIGGGWEEGTGGNYHGAIRLGSGANLQGTLNLMGDASVRTLGNLATVSAKLFGDFNLTARSGGGDGTVNFTADNTGWAGSFNIGSGGYRFDALTNLGSPTSIQLGQFGTIIAGFAGVQTAVIDKVGFGSLGTVALRAANATETIDFRGANAAGLFLGANENLTYAGTYSPNLVNGQPNVRLGGGGATLTYVNAITGNAAVFIGGGAATNSYGTVVLNPTTPGANTYVGGTTIGANTSYAAVEVPAVANPFAVFGNGPLTFVTPNATFRLAAALPNADADLSSAANLTSIVINGGAKFDTNRAADTDTVVFARGIGAYGASGSFLKQGRGILRLDGINTYLGNTDVIGRTAGNGVSALHLNNANPFNAGYAPNGAASGTLLYFNPGTNNDQVGSLVQLNRAVSIPAIHAPAVGTTTVVAPVGSVVNLNGFDLTLTGSGSSQFAGVINGGIGSLGTLGVAGIIKTGSGTFTLQANNSGNYSGKTIVRGGVLQLNFNALTTAPSSMINTGSTLELGGGTLDIVGKSATTNTQQFNGLNLLPGASRTTRTLNTATALTLNLGPIARPTAGSAIDFVFSSMGTGGIVVSSFNEAGDILGGFATVEAGAGFATISSGKIAALPIVATTASANSSASTSLTVASATGVSVGNNIAGAGIPEGTTVTAVTGNVLTLSQPATVASASALKIGSYAFAYAAGANVDNGAMATIGASPVSINSLRFNEPAQVELNATAGLTIASGGILMTNAVGANDVTIKGGTLTSGNGRDLILHQWNTSASGFLAIESKITGNIGLTKSGPGYVILRNGANDFVGNVTISGGTNSTFRVEATGALGASTNVVNIFSAGQFQIDQDVTIANPINVDFASGRVGEGAIFLSASTGVGTLSGPIRIEKTTIAGGLFASNGATLVISGPVTAAAGQVVTARAGNVRFSNDPLVSGVSSDYDYFINQGAVVSLGATNALSTRAIVDIGSAGAATIDLNGYDQTIGALTRITAGPNRIVTNSSASLSTLTINVAANDGGILTGDWAYAGQLTGRLALVKSGAGLQLLSGENFHTGGTTVNAGTLRLGHVNALGGDTGFNGALTVNGGVLDIFGSGNAAIGTLAGAGGIITDSGLAFGGSVLSTFSPADSLFAGAINDGAFRTLSLYKDGVGVLALSGASGYTGVTKVFQGALAISHGAALGASSGSTVVSAGAALRIAGDITSAEPLSLAGAGMAGTGVLRNLSGANTLSGAIALSAPSRFVSDAGTLTLGGALSGVGHALTLGGAGDLVLGGSLSLGSAGLTKEGLGVATLGAANTFTGATVVAAGALRLADASALGSSVSLTVASGAGLQLAGGIAYAGVAATTPLLQNVGGTNAWSVGLRPTDGGALTLRSDAGVLTLNGPAGSLNARSADGVDRALVLTGAGAGVLATDFINAAAFTKSGAGVWTISSPQTFAIETAIDGGTLKAGAAGVLSAASTVRFADVAGATLDLDGTVQSVRTLEGAGATGGAVALGATGELTVGANTAFGGAVAGSGTSRLIKSGTGVFTMGPTSALTGTVAVNVNGGTFSFGGNAGANVSVQVASATVLRGSGSFLGAVNVANGGVVEAGNGVAGSLSVASLVLGSSVGDIATLRFRNIDLGGSASVMNIGALTANGGAGSVLISAVNGGALANGTYLLANFTTPIADFGVFGLGTITGLGGRQSGAFVTADSSKLSVAITGDSVRWQGDVGGTPDTVWHIPGGANNLRVVPGGAPTDFRANDAIVFNDDAAAGTVVISEGAVSPSSLTIDNPTLAYAFSGDYGVTGATGIVKNGAGQATFANLGNSFTGGVTVNAGTLVFQSAQTIAGGLTVNGGNLVLGAANTLSGNVVLNGAGSLTLGAAGALGTGNSLAFGSGASGEFKLAGNSATLSGLTTHATVGTPTVVNGVSATTATLTVDLASGTQTFAGVLADGSLGTLAFAKSGAGTFILTGANTLTGGTTVSAGTLQVGQGGSLGDAAIASGALLSFNRADVFTYAGGTTGAGSVSVVGGGNMTITGALGHNGGTFVGSGQILTLGTGSSVGGAGALTVDGYLKVNTTGSAAIGSVIGGVGSLSVDAGTLVLTGANTYQGTTTVASGATLQIGVGSVDGALPPSAVVANSGSLVVSRSGSLTFANAVNGTGDFVSRMTDGGVLTLAGVNGYSGVTKVENGTLVIGSPAAWANSTAVVLGSAGKSATLELNGFSKSFSSLSTLGVAGAQTVRNSGVGTATLTFTDSGARTTRSPSAP